jgi:NAD(P)-dependent dehydrogenase (short-subunit alcohol dehydrogenase family)
MSQENAPDNVPVWFITGCSTGFGREIARQVLGRGWRAVVTARIPEQVRAIVAGHEDHALALALDVDDKDAIARGVETAEEKFGRIDILVNNAGYGYLAAIEEGEDDEVRAMFETNVFGLIALTKAVLPGMRARTPNGPSCMMRFKTRRSSTCSTSCVPNKSPMSDLGQR